MSEHAVAMQRAEPGIVVAQETMRLLDGPGDHIEEPLACARDPSQLAGVVAPPDVSDNRSLTSRT